MTKAALHKKADGTAEDQTALLSAPISASRQKRRFLLNRGADVVVRLGGLGVLIAISAIFLVIFFEALPLFKSASAELRSESNLVPSSSYLLAGYFADGEGQFVLDADGQLNLFHKDSAASNALSYTLALPENVRILSSVQANREPDSIFLGGSDGRVYRFRLPSFPLRAGEQSSLSPDEVLSPDELYRPVRQLNAVRNGKSEIVAALYENEEKEELHLLSLRPGKGLMGDGQPVQLSGSLGLESKTSAMAMSSQGDLLFLADREGKIKVVDTRKANAPRVLSEVVVGADDEITSLAVALGDQTILLGKRSGAVETWMFVGGTPFNGAPLQLKAHVYQYASPIKAISPSGRNRTFLSATENGEIGLHFATSGETQLNIRSAAQKVSDLRFSSRGKDFFVLFDSGLLQSWSVDNPHPEITFKSLFSRIWYEGYAAPEFVWQSSSGSDEFEPKFSLTPLLFGTLKGTFYSLLFAVPLALLGAVYTAEFMSASLKSIIKPTLELMAALPSVVIGFIAGLWLAPNLGPYIPALMIFPLILLFMVALACVGWSFLPDGIRATVPHGIEVLLLVPVVFLSGTLAASFGSSVESVFLGGDYQHWLSESFSVVYDQRNSIVVGMAMGFAIIPIIFTIAEDSLSTVPRQLAAGSLALGASRWQTAMRVIIPAASPGMFSAIMLGFGRAVGETMIVLMATGNTPVMESSPFNGFRALSANIAVELPEAAVGSTLFRVLFFAALLLFVLTFIVNSLTEIVRQRLRRKYSQV